MRGSGPLNSSSKSVIESLCNRNATVVYAHASTFMFYTHTNLCATTTASYHHNIQQTTTGIRPAWLFFSSHLSLPQQTTHLFYTE